MTTEAVTFRAIIVSLLPVIFLALVGTIYQWWLLSKFNKINDRLENLENYNE